MKSRKIIAAVLVLCFVLSMMPMFDIEAHAATVITDPWSVQGGDYSDEYATKLDNIFKGYVSLFSNTDSKYPLGSSISGSYSVANTITGAECYIYAQAVYYYLFGDIPYHGTGINNYWNNSTVVLTNESQVSYNQFKNAGVAFGAYVRTTGNSNGSYHSKNGHSLIILYYDSENITYLDCNANGDELIRIWVRSWDEFNYNLLSKKGRKISHVVQAHGAELKDPADTPVDLGTNFYAYIINTESWKHLTNDGNNVSLRTETGDANQIWYFERQSDGSYSIRSALNMWAMEVWNFSDEDGANVQTYPYNGNDAQLWYITGEWTQNVFRAKCTDCVLDVEGGGTEDGTNIQMWTYNGTDAQLFRVWKLDDYIMKPTVSTASTTYSYGSTVTINWSEALGATAYWLNIWKEGDVREQLVSSNVGLTTSYTFSPEPGTYLIYVESCSDDPEWKTCRSDAYYFTVKNKEYSITYNANGGTGAPPSQIKSHDVPLTLSSTIPTRKGYSFLGWATSAKATTAEYQPGDAFKKNENSTLYAVWKIGCADEHSYGDWVLVQEPTCTEPGQEKRTCALCGAVVTRTVSKREHNYTGKITSPTCTEDGFTTYTCGQCGDSYISDYVDAIGHKEVIISGKEATCTESGLTDSKKCSACGEVTVAQEEIPAQGHEYKDGKCVRCGIKDPDYSEECQHTNAVFIETVAPTCVNWGYDTYKCLDCGFILADGFVEPTGEHKLVAIAELVEPTCTENGMTEGVKCAYCGEILVARETIPALGHIYEAVVTAPTCTEQGYTTYTCTVCGDSYVDDYTDTLGHAWDEGVVTTEPTCTTKGTTKYVCVNCGSTKLVKNIPALGHNPQGDVYTEEATCVKDGYTYQHCLDCGARVVLERSEKVPYQPGDYYTSLEEMAHHKSVEFVEHYSDGSCTILGLDKYYCSDCENYILLAVEGTGNGHSYEAAVTDPTCTEEGFTTHTCTVCGDRYTDNHTDALGHREVIDEAVEATCTEDGLSAGSHCDVCGEVLNAQVVIPATGHLDEDRNFICDTCGADLCTEHVEQIIPAILPTCTEEGMTEGVKCANCGEILVARETIPALGHSYEASVTAPTCTEEGYTTYTCTVCGDRNVSDHVYAFGHQEVIDEGVAATCTEDGLSEGSHCSVCGEVLTEQEVIPAIGHLDENKDFICDTCGTDLCTEHIVENISEKLPTCTEDGLTQGIRCANCGEILVAQEVIPALGHSMGQWYEETAPTCTETGVRRTDCERCDYFETEQIAAKGHNYTGVVTAPTCTEIGYTTYTCEHCGDSYIDEFVAAKGHSFGDWVTDREPTCAEPGIKSRTCTCGETETEALSALGHDFQDGKCSRCGELDAAPEAVPGDVNGDGKVDTTDAKLIMQFDLGIIDETALNLSVADVNGDGMIDTTDAKLIMQLDLGIITAFPNP